MTAVVVLLTAGDALRAQARDNAWIAELIEQMGAGTYALAAVCVFLAAGLMALGLLRRSRR